MSRDGSGHLKRTVTCVHDGCGKTFTRLDMKRHQSNHLSASHPCDRCSKTFKRLDLLALHRSRHDKATSASLSSQRPHTPSANTPSPTSQPASLTSTTPSFPSGAAASSASPAAAASFDFPSWLLDAEQVALPWEQATWGQVGASPTADQQWDSLVSSLGAAPLDDYSWLAALGDGDATSSTLGQTNGQIDVGGLWDEFDLRMDELLGAVDSDATPVAHDLCDEESRNRILSDFPHVPLADSPWFSLSSLRLAIDSYFAAFHSQFPLLHRPTFDPSLTSSHQLLLLVLIGQAHFTTPVTEFAHLSPFVRAKLTLFLSPDMSLDILQTLLLCSFYDEFMSSTSAQVAAQCFSATLVSIARRNSMMVRRGTSASTAAGTGLSLSSMERWKAWVSEELFARAAFALIYLDSQLSASWGQVCGRRHTLFAIQVPLPATTAEWEATTAEQWILMRDAALLTATSSSSTTNKADSTFLPGIDPSYRPRTAQPGFSASLKAALGANGTVPGSEDCWTRFLILHGLCTVAWDLKMRGTVGVLFRDTPGKLWQPALYTAMSRLADLPFADDSSPTMLKMYRNASAMALVAIFSDVIALQVFAGVATVSGSAVGTQQYVASRRKLLSWVKTHDGWTAVWHSARFLRDVYRHDLDGAVPLASSWTVFIATILCWTFCTLSTDVPPGSGAQPSPQLVIPSTLRFLSTITRQSSEEMGSVAVGSSSVVYQLLAAGHWYLTDKSPHWGSAVDGAETLARLMLKHV